MPDDQTSTSDSESGKEPIRVVRRRPKPGERRIQILHALAAMLEQPGSERITTAALAARLDVSEAALYRHFASKAQMFEGLIDFIEQSVFSFVNQNAEREQATEDAASGSRQAARLVTMLLQFAEKNPGLTRVIVGDALVFENERLQQRMNNFFDKIEAALRQALRVSADANGSASPSVDSQVVASALTAFTVGRLHRYARSGFKRSPTEHLEASLARML